MNHKNLMRQAMSGNSKKVWKKFLLPLQALDNMRAAVTEQHQKQHLCRKASVAQLVRALP